MSDTATTDASDDGSYQKLDEQLRESIFNSVSGSCIELQQMDSQTEYKFKNINYSIKFIPPPTTFSGKVLSSILQFIPLVPNGRSIKRQILFDISGTIKSGETLAIMGPTGSGKTTLLNVLSGRVRTGVTGDMLYNGSPITNKERKHMAYVLQDDIFFAHLSVIETMTFSALLRLPSSLSFSKKRQRVKQVIEELSLTACKNTSIGNPPFVRGVSGGERKRANIGTELLANPRMILLDEPTSGLDSSTALKLMTTLKSLASAGRAVIATIHQPSSQLFHMFDKVLLLSSGRIVYHGKASGMVKYFTNLGFPRMKDYNPADYAMEVISTSADFGDTGKSVKDTLIEKYIENAKKKRKRNRKKKKKRQLSKKDKQVKENTVAASSAGHCPNVCCFKKNDGVKKYESSWPVQFGVLLVRSFKQSKGTTLTGLNFFNIIAVTVICAMIWFRMDYEESDIRDRTGYIFFTVMFWTFYPWFVSMMNFPTERAVVAKERASGAYHLSAYYLAKITSELPILSVLPLIWILVDYWIVGLAVHPGSFFYAVGLVLLTTYLGSSIGVMVGALVGDLQRAMVYSGIVILTFMLLGGFYIPSSKIPVWIRWVAWVSPIKYSYEAFLTSQFEWSDDTFTNSETTAYDVNPIDADAILDQLDVTTTVWLDNLVMVAMILLCHTTGYLSLRFLNRIKR
eukprot:TRINITY_DN3471_c0_g1_i1.p1 TRINITY_DN3471_c0_g1~~TRINITY_DN3471_c0_g1_i1.p1  ORF type:complete len:683 (+),score=93.82 TRINITY_DN3471_c0_g1_i1:3-2051(+)